MKRFIAAALIFAACDSASPEEVEFRNGPPEVLYLSQDDAEIDLWTFAKLVQSCAKIEDLQVAITWTAYPPDVAGGGRVLGFGFSAFAHDEIITCYEELMIKLGASPLP